MRLPVRRPLAPPAQPLVAPRGTINSFFTDQMTSSGAWSSSSSRDWYDDPGEKGRRIWEWWRSRLLDEICPFVYFKEAVRLVVLVQTSSASIERVFSEVKRILASVGDSILEDNLELRLFRRCAR